MYKHVKHGIKTFYKKKKRINRFSAFWIRPDSFRAENAFVSFRDVFAKRCTIPSGLQMQYQSNRHCPFQREHRNNRPETDTGRAIGLTCTNGQLAVGVQTREIQRVVHHFKNGLPG